MSDTFDETVNVLIDSAMKLTEHYEVSSAEERVNVFSSRVRAGKVEKFNIREFFESAVRESSELQRAKQLKININMDMTMPMEAMSVKGPLFQAVTSSLKQAISTAKYLGRFNISLNSQLSMVKVKKFFLLVDFDWQTEEQINEFSMSSSALLKPSDESNIWENSLCAKFEQQARLVEALGGDF